MPGVWDKLQLKDQQEVLVLNAPESFEPEIRKLKLRNVTVNRTAQGLKDSAAGKAKTSKKRGK